MNREILFRAKSQYNDGRWEYGLLSRLNELNAVIIDERLSHLCEPDTLGQYTGLTDKNYNRVFEGDTLDNGYAVQMEDGRWLARNGISVIEAEYFCNFEITGTIHD